MGPPPHSSRNSQAPSSEGLGRAEVGNRRQTHRIVNRREVGWLLFPLAASTRQLFSFLLKRVHPLPDHRSLIHTGLEAPVVVVILGHCSDTRGLEDFFDLMVGELADEACVEAPSLFADQRVTQSVVSR